MHILGLIGLTGLLVQELLGGPRQKFLQGSACISAILLGILLRVLLRIRGVLRVFSNQLWMHGSEFTFAYK